MPTVIRAANVSKQYLIRHEGGGSYVALRDVMADSFRRLLGGARSRTAAIEDFWALRDVSFDVERGDVLGVIGRNGAGKSTLLKILSRITEPTAGEVELGGRVASLLEVGTGFHPELTGSENIRLNGAILGMSAAEIRRKFDEIVAFADVERFLDTPVKRYSSGMQVRLAFSVAAHLEPEILLIDEVLAVGDAEFQRKCLGKMHEVSRGGRTVIFVSHNMAAVQALCNKVLFLDAGKVRGVGRVDQLIHEYMADTRQRPGAARKGPLRVNEWLSVRECELAPNPVESGGAVQFRLELMSRIEARLSELALILYNEQGFRVAVFDFRSCGLPATLGAGQRWQLRGEVPSLPLVEGDYAASLFLRAADFVDDIDVLTTLTVSPRRTAAAHAPYGAADRGVLEAEFKLQSAGPAES